MHGAGWLNVQTGVSRVTIEPYGNCFCGVKEVATSTSSVEFKMNQKVSTICSFLFHKDCTEQVGNQHMSECAGLYNVIWVFQKYKILILAVFFRHQV
jgi:hypothetical protein